MLFKGNTCKNPYFGLKMHKCAGKIGGTSILNVTTILPSCKIWCHCLSQFVKYTHKTVLPPEE